MISIIFMCFLFIALVMESVFIVKQQTCAVIERFGKFNRIATPGLNFKIPLIDNVASKISLKIFQLDVKIETKTQDNVFVDIMVAVQYQVLIDKIYEAYYLLQDPDSQIKSFVFDLVRALVPTLILDDLFAKKDNIADAVARELQSTMHNFGYEIIKTLVTDISPDANVKAAMNEINTAQRLRCAALEKAEAEKIMRVKQAEAEAEANVLHGKGIAGQRQAIIDGLSASISDFSKVTNNAQNALDMVLLVQYMDMLKEIGSNANSGVVFLSHNPSSIKDLEHTIQQSIISGNQAEKMLKK